MKTKSDTLILAILKKIMKKLINKNMKTTKKQKEISKKHYEKNKHIISERNKQNRKRQQRLDKIYFYGFWLLLTAVLVDTFINQILK